MQLFKVIQQVDKQTFRVLHLNALNESEFRSKKISLGITFDDVEAFGWSDNEYPVDKFLIRWGGRQTSGNAYIFYLNKTSGTKTFIDLVKDVPDLETIAQLMNKYANLNIDQVWQLLENSIHRLGHYHRLHQVANKGGMDQAYKFIDQETFDPSDYDRQCLQYFLDTQRTAVALKKKISYLNQLTKGIGEIAADKQVRAIVDMLKTTNDEYNVTEKSNTWNGRFGPGHSGGEDFKTIR